MGKLNIYECDRCNKEFKLKDDESPFTITFVEQKEAIFEDIVCEDCYYTMMSAMGEFSDEVDKVIEEAFEKKYPD